MQEVFTRPDPVEPTKSEPAEVATGILVNLDPENQALSQEIMVCTKGCLIC